MAASPLTPQEDPSDAQDEIRYDETFERDLARLVSNPPPADGIRIVYGDEKPGEDELNITDAWAQELPKVEHDELPLPLADPRRKFWGPVAGVRLTHPGGLLEGGPASDDSVNEAQKFINHFQIRDPVELRQRVVEQMELAMEELKSRANARQAAVENNEKVDRDLAQREMEDKIWQRLRDQAREKKRAGG